MPEFKFNIGQTLKHKAAVHADMMGSFTMLFVVSREWIEDPTGSGAAYYCRRVRVDGYTDGQFFRMFEWELESHPADDNA